MKTALILLAGVLAGVAFLAAREKPKDYESAEAVLARVPQKARAKTNPLASDAEAPLAGKKLFEQHCGECHGESADGSQRGPALRGALLQQATGGDLFWILTNGVVRRGMPAWSKLPEPQRWQIVAFLNSLPRSPDKEKR